MQDIEKILNLSHEELEALPTETLVQIKDALDTAAALDETEQKSLKLMINSLYGAQANKHFVMANPDLAAAVTASGRFFIQLMAIVIEEKLQELLPSPKPYLVYGDTDSCVSSSVLRVNNKQITIGDYFDNNANEVFKTSSGCEVKPVDGDVALTFDMESGVHNARVKYVMRHKVSKRLFKIKANRCEVVVTADHSIKVIRNGELIDAKPNEIGSADKIISLRNTNDQNELEIVITDDFIIEDLGEHEEYVYDIEVEGTHSFFANDILVHNSVYYHIEPFVTKKFGENAQPTKEVIDWCDRFEKRVIQACIAETIDRYGEILNVYDKAPIGVEREMISDSAVFVAKKKYFARVMDMEGVRYDLEDPYIKVMGLEVAKSGTSKWVKEKLKESIGVILDKDARGLQAWRDKVKMEFSSQKIDDICTIQGISNLQYNLGDKGIPQGSKSALVHNKWVKDNGLEDEIPLLTAGEKYKRCYLLQPNRFGSEIISFDSDRIAKIIEEDGIYDYATNFEKQFEKPLENMVECLGYDLTNKPKFDLEDW